MANPMTLYGTISSSVQNQVTPQTPAYQLKISIAGDPSLLVFYSWNTDEPLSIDSAPCCRGGESFYIKEPKHVSKINFLANGSGGSFAIAVEQIHAIIV